ncbi:MAG: alpha/beta hydrolase-fold protein [Anaerolineae bacterium]
MSTSSTSSTSLLNRAKRHGTPLIDGDQVTFVWQGEHPVQVVGDFNYWATFFEQPLLMERAGTNLWKATITLPRDAYGEYHFLQGDQHFPDPLNKRTSPNGMGATNNVFWMPDYAPSPLAIVNKEIPHGEVTHYDLNGGWYYAGTSRTVHLYKPPTDEPTPLLIVLDGTQYLRRSKINVIVDNLIAQQRIRPISMAMVEPSKRIRLHEYGCSDVTVAFIVHRLFPLASAHLNLLDYHQHSGVHGIMGASMGGLMSLYTALRVPYLFGKVLSESGAFLSDHLYFDSVIFDLLPHADRSNYKLYMDCGLQEWFIHPNRETYDRLKVWGYDVTFREHSSGHNYPSWRDHLADGLVHLFGV